MSYEDYKKRQRLSIIGVSCLLLVAMAIAVTYSVGFGTSALGDGSNNINGKNHKTEISSSKKAIKSLCQSTFYKKTCEKSLEKSAGNTTDPKKLLKIAFKLAEDQITAASRKSVTLKQLEKEPRTLGALNTCKEVMIMSINELQRSLRRVESFDMSQMEELMADVKTWISAAITYEETCIDAFENTTSNAGEKMKEALKTAMEMSDNGLDIVRGIFSVLSDIQTPAGTSRRLLQDEDDDDKKKNFPAWVDQGTRRILSVSPSRITKLKPDLVVAKDGSGKYKTINQALHHIPKKSKKRFVLYIKEGVYNEYVEFNKNMMNLIAIGDGPNKTRITGNKNFVDGVNTYLTATVAVYGHKFMAMNIGFENSAGAIKRQAVALRVSADNAIFYNCSMDGYQGTLYAHTKRQFYRDCTISGTVDFVFGDAPVVFQNCTFLCRKPLEDQHCVVTAQGRKARGQPSAIIIQNSTITAHPEFEPVKNQFKSYLGRPGKPFSRTVIMESFIDDLIEPDGWLPWLGTFGIKTTWYGEYNNYGPGSDTKKRAKWNGIKPLTRQHAIDFTPGRFLRGETWILPTGVPYTPYLTRP